MPTIIIDGYIGDDEKVDAGAMVAEIGKLKAKGVKQALMRINSGGGDMISGFAIYDAMQESGIEFIGHVIGMAGSMATVLMMGCKTIKMSSNAMLMFHQAQAGMYGTADQLRNMADLTDKLQLKALNVYKARTGLDEEIIKSWLVTGKDTWMTAQEALANKIIDEIVEPVKGFQATRMTSESEAWSRVYSKLDFKPQYTMNKEILKLVGLPEDATQEQYDAKVTELAQAKAQADAARLAAEQQLAQEREAKANALVENALKAGKVKPEAKAEMLTLAKANYEAAEKVIANMNVRQLPGSYVAPGAGPQGSNPEDRSKWKFTDWSRKDPAGLLKMKSEQPEEFQRLFAATGVKITENENK